MRCVCACVLYVYALCVVCVCVCACVVCVVVVCVLYVCVHSVPLCLCAHAYVLCLLCEDRLTGSIVRTLVAHMLSWPEPYIYTVFLAGKSQHVRSNTVYIYGSGQLYSQTAVVIARIGQSAPFA
jgi:hypothetical protein